MHSDNLRKIIGFQSIANPYDYYMQSLANTALGIELLCHLVKAREFADDDLFVISGINFHIFFSEKKILRQQFLGTFQL